jgi:hypothetical protein
VNNKIRTSWRRRRNKKGIRRRRSKNKNNKIQIPVFYKFILSIFLPACSVEWTLSSKLVEKLIE